jgi:protein STE50
VSVTDPNGDISQTPTQKPKISGESGDLLKAFKVSLDDPTWKVLPAALKKYQIEDELWQNYAMFICYGPLGI